MSGFLGNRMGAGVRGGMGRSMGGGSRSLSGFSRSARRATLTCAELRSPNRVRPVLEARRINIAILGDFLLLCLGNAG
jgi:hypothetical protein